LTLAALSAFRMVILPLGEVLQIRHYLSLVKKFLENQDQQSWRAVVDEGGVWGKLVLIKLKIQIGTGRNQAYEP